MKPQLSIVFLLLPLLTLGQHNLVPNGSFEEQLDCPSSAGDWDLVMHWTSPNQKSPDYFDTCAHLVQGYYVGVPSNIFGWQVPVNGSCYLGVGCYNLGSPESREYIQSELESPLTSNVRYEVKFYASAANRFQYAISTLGAALTNDLPAVITVDAPNGMIDAVPQVLNRQGPIIDTVRWVLICDTIVAQGGERYLTIGNFNLDAESDTVRFNPDQPPIFSNETSYAYYYIDDVSVVAIDTLSSGVGISENDVERFKVYPNPTNGFMTLNYTVNEGDDALVEVYNLLGKRVYANSISSNESVVHIDLQSISSGLYTLRLIVNNEIRFTEKVSASIE